MRREQVATVSGEMFAASSSASLSGAVPAIVPIIDPDESMSLTGDWSFTATRSGYYIVRMSAGYISPSLLNPVSADSAFNQDVPSVGAYMNLTLNKNTVAVTQGIVYETGTLGLLIDSTADSSGGTTVYVPDIITDASVFNNAKILTTIWMETGDVLTCDYAHVNRGALALNSVTGVFAKGPIAGTTGDGVQLINPPYASAPVWATDSINGILINGVALTGAAAYTSVGDVEVSANFYIEITKVEGVF